MTWTTDFPNLNSGESINGYSNRNHLYSFEVVEFGTYRFTDKKNLK